MNFMVFLVHINAGCKNYYNLYKPRVPVVLSTILMWCTFSASNYTEYCVYITNRLLYFHGLRKQAISVCVCELSFIFKTHFIHILLFFTLQLEIWSNLSNFSPVASASTDTATPNYCHASTHSAWNHAWKDWWTTYADRYVYTE